ncbi:hypothetical protein HETIRDRAFT_163718 [Heterobasidion irregulare TC 32-1]|uniref:Uncharacterized protein n=1 Tax=Heterobasidion irregulare (strain TC 32-1) TaxID=747525 RepID=W4JXD6_HETIT|nr:uncharacterized protein HETIRDRAFT_163718 [Heterobasidion irregulare TC 32-1]ETW77735.1 hypothetical protein HETIRDRAFT_163718 [Heterobasidion irregulare TC 32-1]
MSGADDRRHCKAHHQSRRISTTLLPPVYSSCWLHHGLDALLLSLIPYSPSRPCCFAAPLFILSCYCDGLRPSGSFSFTCSTFLHGLFMFLFFLPLSPFLSFTRRRRRRS